MEREREREQAYWQFMIIEYLPVVEKINKVWIAVKMLKWKKSYTL